MRSKKAKWVVGLVSLVLGNALAGGAGCDSEMSSMGGSSYDYYDSGYGSSSEYDYGDAISTYLGNYIEY